MKAIHVHLGEVEIDDACLELDKLDAIGDERHVIYEGDIRKVTASQVCEIGRNGIHTWNPSPNISASHHPSRCLESRQGQGVPPTEPAALPQSLVTKATEAILQAQGYETEYEGDDHFPVDPNSPFVHALEEARAALQAAGLPALLQELQNIANANPTDWRDDFQAWAQSRARHTLRQVLGADYKEGE